jgi:CPA2 family monovalent cation:H+ antiporter-2
MPKLLSDVALCLGASLAVVLLFRRLALPSVAGFLLSGMLIGPSGLGLIAGAHVEVDAAERLLTEAGVAAGGAAPDRAAG